MQTQTRKLYRSRTDTKISGVCGGIADHFDTDPVFVRLAFVGLTLLAPPAGILGYLACWLILPEEPSAKPASGQEVASGSAPDTAGTDPAGQAAPRASAGAGSGGDGPLFAGAILIAVGAFFLLLNLGFFDWSLFRFWRWRAIWPIAVIFLGAVIVYRALRPSGLEKVD